MKVKKNIITKQVTLYIKAGEASTSPPIGPIITQFGIDVKQFCNNFNNDTKEFEKGILLKIIVSIYKNNTFTYVIKTSPLFFLFELASEDSDDLNIILYNKYWDSRYIRLEDIYLITLIKNLEYNLISLKKLFKMIIKEAKKYKYFLIEYLTDDYCYLYT